MQRGLRDNTMENRELHGIMKPDGFFCFQNIVQAFLCNTMQRRGGLKEITMENRNYTGL
jgi:hypothetical protein